MGEQPEHPMKKNLGGHPRIFKTPEQMQKAIDEYFLSCYKYDYVLSNYGIVKNPEWIDDDITPDIDKYIKRWQQVEQPTISGLAVSLGVDRRTILNYSNLSEFFPTISHARNLIEKEVVAKLFDKGACAGAKFNLMNNYGHKEKSEVEQTSITGATINIVKKEDD